MADNNNNDNTKSHLFALPPEIRNEIYGYVALKQRTDDAFGDIRLFIKHTPTLSKIIKLFIDNPGPPALMRT